MTRPGLFVAAWSLVGALVVIYLVSGAIGDVRARFLARRRDRVLGVIGVVLFETDDQAEAVYERVAELPRRALLSVLQHLAVELEGEALERVRRLVRTMGLERYIRRRSRSRRWRMRVQAAQLHHLVVHPDFDRRRLLVDRHPLVVARAAEALTPQLATEHLDTLLPMLASDDAAIRLAAQQAVLSAGAAAVPQLLDRLATTTGPDDTVAILEVVANLSDQRLVAGLGLHARSTDVRVRRLAAKALGHGSGPGAVATLHELLDDPSELVRATAVESLARMDSVASVNRIGALMNDASFVVRRTAGLALDQLGSPGRLALRRVLECDDRFARDMARQVLDSAGARLGVNLVPASIDVLIDLDEADPYEAIEVARPVDLRPYGAERIRATVHAEANRALAEAIGEAGEGPLTEREISTAMFMAISAADLVDALLGTSAGDRR